MSASGLGVAELGKVGTGVKLDALGAGVEAAGPQAAIKPSSSAATPIRTGLNFLPIALTMPAPLSNTPIPWQVYMAL